MRWEPTRFLEKKLPVICSLFDKFGTIEANYNYNSYMHCLSVDYTLIEIYDKGHFRSHSLNCFKKLSKVEKNNVCRIET